MTDDQRLLKVYSLLPADGSWDINSVRPFYFASTRLMNVIMYYIVPFSTVTMGRVVAHIDPNNGKIIAFKSGRSGLNYHVSRVKRGTLDPNVIAIVDNAIRKM